MPINSIDKTLTDAEIDTMMKKAPALGWLLPIPFYFLEALVGFVQALVFTLLSAVFIMLVCTHEGDHERDSELSVNHVK